MKRGYLYRVYGALLLLFGTACASDGQEECLPCVNKGIVEVRLAGTLPATGLETPLYLFRRDAGSGDAYTFVRGYGSVTDGERLKLPLSEIKGSDYRFLMIAQPTGGAWLSLRTAEGSTYAPGETWDGLRLTCTSGSAGPDGYCGFTDLSGAAILADGTVRLKLTRIAGQVLFDFFRIGSSLSQPESVVSADVESVLDRVTGIEIEYLSPTVSLRFDTDGALIPAAYAAEPLRQDILPVMENFRVSLPQADLGLGVYDASLRGSLRVEGAYLLPSDAKLRVNLTFTYYDTTPTCDNDHTEDHTEACYGLQRMSLTLPSVDAPAGLPVAADCFTVNKAGLRCDRIIDVPVGGSIVMEFGWL